MRDVFKVRGFIGPAISLLLSGCGFLPGFGIFEDAPLYILPVGGVANQVACELQEFVLDNKRMEKMRKPTDPIRRWRLANEDVGIKLTVATDTAGYVNFTGVNVNALGFSDLASFITSQSKVPSLAAKISGKRTKTVTVSFSVSPNPLPSSTKNFLYDPVTNEPISLNCAKNWRAHDPLVSLYLRDWLTSYFETINTLDKYQEFPSTDNLSDNVARGLRRIAYPDAIPQQFKVQSVELSTQFVIGADLSGGATPNILGNGSVFIVPINGLSLDYNPDYLNKVDIVIAMCDSLAEESTCNGKATPTDYYPILDKQCQIYAYLAPLLTVKKPRDYEDSKGKVCQGKCTCSKDKGVYVSKKI